MTKFDRYIFKRLFIVTFFVMIVLICIFILIDFSENSDEFTEKGATIAEILSVYYLNYIPEMIRLMSPLAVFVACLILTGQMTERLELIALKASGVSLYRLVLPYLIFGFLVGASVSYLDAYVIPTSNADRIEFESRYLSGSTDRIDRGRLFRQDSDSTIVSFNFFEASSNTGYQASIVTFRDDKVSRISNANRIEWNDSLSVWRVDRLRERVFDNGNYVETDTMNVTVDLNLYPRDLARRSSDIYQLTYPEAVSYIESIERIGAGGTSLPRTQLYSRIAYPISIFVVCLIGFALASERRRGGRGFYIAAGLGISIIYLAFMKILEPFGYAGTLSPEFASIFPHALFLLIGIILLLIAKK
ncbi:YjgP/YjgQ family permease [Rhodohalobacter sp. SW132]|uniref:LptF/LptG family permease n=1 Tax=Rhodohalobacter sp. SW132 TaxID=2293433 RepID=UPI000E23B281|nr:LptF/LptG family permease [Rhodohalobacter sp. SW132]REL24099.1 YjgP/YjgQ family permease [Rhodohalobacter sp. SW132]